MILVKSMGEAQGPCVRAKVGEEPEGSSTLEEAGGGRLWEAGRARPTLWTGGVVWPSPRGVLNI